MIVSYKQWVNDAYKSWCMQHLHCLHSIILFVSLEQSPHTYIYRSNHITQYNVFASKRIRIYQGYIIFYMRNCNNIHNPWHFHNKYHFIKLKMAYIWYWSRPYQMHKVVKCSVQSCALLNWIYFRFRCICTPVTVNWFLAHLSIMLRMSFSDRSPSVVHRPSARRLFTFSNDFSSETTVLFPSKLCLKHHCTGGTNNF